MSAGEFLFNLSKSSLAKPGTITFELKNIGHIIHDFRIDGKQTPLIQPSQTAKLIVAFNKAGKYPYLCSAPDTRRRA